MDDMMPRETLRQRIAGGLDETLDLLERGHVSISDLPEGTRRRLVAALNKAAKA